MKRLMSEMMKSKISWVGTWDISGWQRFEGLSTLSSKSDVGRQAKLVTSGCDG